MGLLGKLVERSKEVARGSALKAFLAAGDSAQPHMWDKLSLADKLTADELVTVIQKASAVRKTAYDALIRRFGADEAHLREVVRVGGAVGACAGKQLLDIRSDIETRELVLKHNVGLRSEVTIGIMKREKQTIDDLLLVIRFSHDLRAVAWPRLTEQHPSSETLGYVSRHAPELREQVYAYMRDVGMGSV